MSLETKKIELAKWILSLEDESMIKKIQDLIYENPLSLSENELNLIDLGIESAKKGKRISFQDYLKKHA